MSSHTLPRAATRPHRLLREAMQPYCHWRGMAVPQLDPSLSWPVALSGSARLALVSSQIGQAAVWRPEAVQPGCVEAL
eukprot:13341448-Alexandrium_andersonii.AAC.1